MVVTLEYFYLVSPKETLYLWRGVAAVAHQTEVMDLVAVQVLQAAEQRGRSPEICMQVQEHKVLVVPEVAVQAALDLRYKAAMEQEEVPAAVVAIMVAAVAELTEMVDMEVVAAVDTLIHQ